MLKIDFKKKSYEKWWIWLLVSILYFAVLIMISNIEEDNEKQNQLLFQNKTSNTTSKELKNNKDLTSKTWNFPDEEYSFAIEIDDYDGDIYESGKYNFTINNVYSESSKENNNKENKIPVMYDIYVTDQNYKSISDVQNSDIEPITVGGISALADKYQGIDLILEKGEYVFVIPFDEIGEETGTLEIKKIN